MWPRLWYLFLAGCHGSGYGGYDSYSGYGFGGGGYGGGGYEGGGYGGADMRRMRRTPDQLKSRRRSFGNLWHGTN